MRLPIPVTIPPMEARIVDALPEGDGWQFEPKWDGFRCLAFRDGDVVELQAKSGKPLMRYFPEMVAALRALPLRRFVLDGELAIPIGDRLSFDALQLRLHPAESRVRKLASETPSILILFDCLYTGEGRRSARRDADGAPPRARAILRRDWQGAGATPHRLHARSQNRRSLAVACGWGRSTASSRSNSMRPICRASARC